MKLSSHEEYGLRCLLQVARQGVEGNATIPEISRNEGISEPYAAKLLRVLRQAGLVKAARGKVGGYTLAVAPDRICVGDALRVLGGRIYDEDFCHRHAGMEICCAHSTQCAIRTLWRSLQGAIDNLLHATSLRDLLEAEHAALPAPADSIPGKLISLGSLGTHRKARPRTRLEASSTLP